MIRRCSGRDGERAETISRTTRSRPRPGAPPARQRPPRGSGLPDGGGTNGKRPGAGADAGQDHRQHDGEVPAVRIEEQQQEAEPDHLQGQERPCRTDRRRRPARPARMRSPAGPSERGKRHAYDRGAEDPRRRGPADAGIRRRQPQGRQRRREIQARGHEAGACDAAPSQESDLPRQRPGHRAEGVPAVQDPQGLAVVPFRPATPPTSTGRVRPMAVAGTSMRPPGHQQAEPVDDRGLPGELPEQRGEGRRDVREQQDESGPAQGDDGLDGRIGAQGPDQMDAVPDGQTVPSANPAMKLESTMATASTPLPKVRAGQPEPERLEDQRRRTGKKKDGGEPECRGRARSRGWFRHRTPMIVCPRRKSQPLGHSRGRQGIGGGPDPQTRMLK